MIQRKIPKIKPNLKHLDLGALLLKYDAKKPQKPRS
jgi:hypothetical protein